MGGGPKHLFQLIQGIQTRYPNWHIAVAAPREGPYGPRFQRAAQRYFALPPSRFSPRALWQLNRWVRLQPPDLIHSHGRGAGVYARLLKSVQPALALVHTFHGVHRPPGARGALKIVLDKVLAPMTDRFICVSRQERDEVVRLGLGRAEKIALVFNGIDIDAIWNQCRQTSRTEVRQRWRVEADAFLLGTLARLDYQKGIDRLILALKQLQGAHPGLRWKCLVAGEGGERKALEHALRQNDLSCHIHLIGEIAEPTDLLAALDVYVSFSRWEGMPLSVLEAMACGLPCLLSDVVGHRDLITSGDNGFLFAPDNTAGFAALVAELAVSPDLCANVGRRAQAAVRQRHGLDQWITRTVQVYEAVFAQGSGGVRRES